MDPQEQNLLQMLMSQQQPRWQLMKSHELFPGLTDNTGLYPSQDLGRGITTPPGAAGTGFGSWNDFFVGHIPDGELTSIQVSFRKKVDGFSRYTTGVYNPNVVYGPDDRMEVLYYYAPTPNREGATDVREEADEVLAKVSITPGLDPLDFEPLVYRFYVAGQITRPGDPVYMRVRFYSDDDATNHFLKNVERVNITGIFGSFDHGAVGAV